MTKDKDGIYRESPVHGFFGLTYASYLVVQRSLMEGMPYEWQVQMVELLEQMRDTYNLDNVATDFMVKARGERGDSSRTPTGTTGVRRIYLTDRRKSSGPAGSFAKPTRVMTKTSEAADRIRAFVQDHEGVRVIIIVNHGKDVPKAVALIEEAGFEITSIGQHRDRRRDVLISVYHNPTDREDLLMRFQGVFAEHVLFINACRGEFQEKVSKSLSYSLTGEHDQLIEITL